MDFDDTAPAEAGGVPAPAPAPARRYVRFTAEVAREVCRRLALGERQAVVCADPAMPSQASVWRWARDRAAFARALARARAVGASVPGGRIYGFCAVAANEIVARVSEGEMLTLICADPHLPSLRTVIRWREDHPEFAEDLRQARAGLAERLSDLGWQMAMEATPETAYLTRVRLGQLRWTASVLGPRTHGRLKPTEPPKEPDVQTICFRHFDIEVNKVTGQRRVIGWTPDPTTMTPVRDHEGEWKDPVDPVAKAAGIEILIREREAREAPAGPPPDDPEGWC